MVVTSAVGRRVPCAALAEHVLAITHIHGIAGRREALRELMRTTQARVAEEPGCRLYSFTAALDDPDEYLHVQEWADEAAFEAHQRSAAFQAYQRDLFELLARPSEMRIHHGGHTIAPVPSGPPDPRGAG
jgi:quinol monooxygenase YgiN